MRFLLLHCYPYLRFIFFSRENYNRYLCVREFDGDAREMKRVDFTDHNGPKAHPNPHQHKIKPNTTGETPNIGDPEPLTN